MTSQGADAEGTFELLVDSIVDYAILTLDPEGHVVSWNRGAQRTKGYSAEEILGQHFGVFYTPQDRAAGRPEQVLAAAAYDGRYEEDGWRVRKDGSRFWASVVVTALRDRSGRLVGFGKVTRDLTERKAAEDALREAMARLEESHNEMERQQRLAGLGQLAAAVSHELRNPLGVLTNTLYLLRSRAEELDDQAMLRSIGLAEREVRAASLIVSELLDYARSRPPSLRRVALAELVEEAISTAARPEGVELSCSVPAELGLVADRDQIRQVLVNLLNNAYQACGSAGRVRIEAAPHGDRRVRLVVADTGSGMTPEVRQRAFEPFYTARAAGTGLGLAVVQRIVETHGGSIDLDSTPGEGTTFSIDLPGG